MIHAPRSSFVAFACVVALVAGAAPPAAATPNCWCKEHKSDCGDCQPGCVVRDFGAIAEFRPLQLHKDDLCKAACRDKIATASETSICADLATNLSVPRPWGGEVQGCWAVGTASYRADARRTVSCPALPPPTGVTYPPPGGKYWKTTHFDDFKGKPAGASPEVAACYDRAPSCATFYVSGPASCPAEAVDGLRGLDKCTWTVLEKQNWMGPDTARFDARQVRVDPARDNGVLVLSARAVSPSGAYLPTGPTKTKDGQVLAEKPYVKRKDWEAGYDCEAVPDAWNGTPQRIKCPIVASAVVSQRYAGGPAGFAQKFGRLSTRAKLAYGAGSYPALWMLPVEGSWPGGGELDIVESPPDGDYVWQTLHSGVCAPALLADLNPDACLAGGGARWKQLKDSARLYVKDIPVKTPYWNSFHEFSVEWDETTLRFLVDGLQTVEVKHRDYVRSTKTGVAHHWWNKSKWEQWMPIHVPQTAFHWILNIAVHEHDGRFPNPKNFVPQEQLIDWVKAEAVCVTREDFCPTGGDFDVPSSQCKNPGGQPATYPSPCRR